MLRLIAGLERPDSEMSGSTVIQCLAPRLRMMC